MNLGKWKYGLKRKLTAILLVMCIFVLTSCSSEGVQESSESVEEPTGIKIGMSFDSFIIERWRRDCDVFVAKIKEYAIISLTVISVPTIPLTPTSRWLAGPMYSVSSADRPTARMKER